MQIGEEGFGGGPQAGAADGIAFAHAFYPAALLQGLHHVLRHRHAADGFDVAARDWLAVGDNSQGFHHGTGVARCTLLFQAAKPLESSRGYLKTPALMGTHQL